ncbi:hypothetical protein FOMPIDRAFT_61328 [Fomitopsis schrenkii]|uniref:Uncharacterized protein n=1 Tax=Fomitopsis schrenkii TaxID=2126942 RepID=S8FLL2_FOMSC|nr:hypothetical protein FOMPIDRAFT_61328 [Fomitopsis schrenkii]
MDFPEIDAGAGVVDDQDDDKAGTPEEEPLALPSDFTSVERKELGLSALAVFEHRIRLGHAHDLLSVIKLSLNHQGAFLADKKKHTHGQKDNTRAQTQVRIAAARTQLLAEVFNYNRDRLLMLSGSTSIDGLPAIDMEKYLKSQNWQKPQEQGDSRHEPSWIWTVTPPWSSASDTAAWHMTVPDVLMVDRVQWFRARAKVARINEEVNKLHAEFKRTHQGFKSMASAWEALLTHTDLSDGARAYVCKKGAMYNALGDKCADLFVKTRKDDEDKWDYTP